MPRIFSLPFKGKVAKATFAIGRVGVGMGKCLAVEASWTVLMDGTRALESDPSPSRPPP